MIKDLWKAPKKHPELREEALDSVAPVKALLTGVFQRLQLKDKSVQVSPAATKEQLASMWESILCIDSAVVSPTVSEGSQISTKDERSRSSYPTVLENVTPFLN